MPEGHIDHRILTLFEEAAPFDEFQNFGLDAYEDWEFADIEELDLED